MKISRENYEIWFTDWFDNNLDAGQTDELYVFLEMNMDLKDEFNSLSSMKLEPEVILYTGKEKLRKSPEQISHAQFELLCAARMENDLTAVQEKEMEEIMFSDNDRRITAEIYERIRLQPNDTVFAGKGRLLRKTAGQKIIRMAVIGLSAAAVTALIITTGLFRQAGTPPPSVPDVRIASNEKKAPSAGIQQSTAPENTNASEDSVSPPENTGEKTEDLPSVEAPENIKREQVPDKIAFNLKPSLGESGTENSLIASPVTYNPLTAESSEDNRSNIGRFLAHTFRSKILDEPSDEPVKGYEIAEVGINGINKLLGWEMALSRNNDENGEVKSVYFSSRMLKFNSPVKNNEVAE